MDLATLDVRFETVGIDDAWEPDPLGYFVIHVTKKGLRLEHYTSDNMPTLVLTCNPKVPLEGQAEALRKAILARFPSILPSHLGYIAQELGKAQVCLEWELEYTQD